MKNLHPILFIFFAACLIMSPTTTFGQLNKSSKNSPQVEIDPVELRALMDAFFYRFSGVVEEAADSIKIISKNKEVAAKALFWKMNAIPAAQQAIFTTNPLEALVDANVLCEQMDHFFKDGAGKSIFIDEQEIAKRASRKLRNEFRASSSQILKNVKSDLIVDEVQFFALNNPIKSLYFNRKSVKPIMAQIFPADKVKLKEMAENINQSVNDLNNRINAYTDLLTNQIRWQSEYMLYETIPKNLKNIPLDTLAFGFDSLIVLAQGMPDLVDEQRELIVKDLQGERKLLVELFQLEKDLAFDMMQAERELILDEIDSLRISAFSDSEEIINKTISQVDNSSKDLVDHIFLKSLIFLGVFLVGMALLILLFKRN